MKILYFDCSSGISGNMTLGALLEIVGNEKYLLKELEKLNIDGYKVDISKKVKNGITGTYVDVILDNINNNSDESDKSDERLHNHEHRNLEDINKIIDKSLLDENVKDLSKRIFLRVAKAESKVHGKSIEEIHFHEVGAIDSIIDIVGTAILINKINPDKVISSIVNDGYGFIECMHGKIPVPVPATSEIFNNSKVKCRQIDIDTELVTPTGAAIIAELSKEFILLPTMKIEKIGWGAGLKDLNIPNVLKVYYGEIENFSEDFIVMETNIDDCSAEILGYTEELLFNNGALDVFFTPIYMKKNRPAYKLTVLCRRNKIKKLQNIIFRETTTIGIRYRVEERIELERECIEIDTKYGKLKAKKAKNNGEEYIYPEYESIKEVALKNDVPVKKIYKEIR